jgi:hypothetical protein
VKEAVLEPPIGRDLMVSKWFDARDDACPQKADSKPKQRRRREEIPSHTRPIRKVENLHTPIC